MRVARAAFIWILLASTAGATSIVILRSADRVYVGADSRRVYLEPSERFQSSVCKIVPAGRLLFVASGLTFANSQHVGDIGASAAQSHSTPDGALEEFHLKMQDFLPAALTQQAKIESYYGESRTGLVLEAAFVGIFDGVPQVAVEWYRNTGDGAHPNVTSDRRVYASKIPGRYDFIFLGKRRAIDTYLAGRSTYITSDEGAQRFIADMIGLEIRESPESTAPPIDILKLDSLDRFRWLQCKAGCGAALDLARPDLTHDPE